MVDEGETSDPSVVGGALFRPVRSGNTFEDTVARLLQTIRLGIVAPGEALPSERNLATRFSVSRDTVRDAIRSLADAGFLVSKRGRYGGTFVSDTLPIGTLGITGIVQSTPTAAEIDDILGLREIIELGAVGVATCKSLSATDRELLWNRFQEVKDAPIDDYRRVDSRFHLTIAELTGLPSLVSLIADNRMRVNQLLNNIPLLVPNIDHSNDQHEAIVVAILTGDKERAVEAMREHLEGSAALLHGFLS
ncbi:MAG TPA: FCD domain-containing protein [Terrimesophilobacter sp.]|uniref:FadR/GntR family transcriptional regulator n=1 Tax=Terrimesophilobacter sp. TaxID=2906435 RepID=UPI002F921061